MTEHLREKSIDKYSRRDVLQLGAAAGSLGLTRLLQASDSANDSPFLVTPYLQLGDAPCFEVTTQIDLLWHTDEHPREWSVEFQNSHNEWIAASVPRSVVIATEAVPAHRVYRATLSGLQPSSRIAYRVNCDQRVVFAATMRTRPASGEPYRLAIMGDCGTGTAPQKKVAYQVFQYDPEMIIIPGDIVYENGRISEYRSSFFPVYSAAKPSPEVGAPLLSRVPFVAGLGQHDTEGDLSKLPDAFAYYMYWSQPLNGPNLNVGGPNTYPLGGNESQKEDFIKAAETRYPRMASFSFDVGNSHWIVLDTFNPHCDWNDNAMREWLIDDLKQAKNATWKFVCSYMPPFSSCRIFPNGQKMRIIAGILEKANVDVVFSGYAHSYQRTYPLHFTPDSSAKGPITDPGHVIPGQWMFDREFNGTSRTHTDGVLYIVTGGGGGINLHSPDQTDNRNSWQPFTVKYHASSHQFSLLDIEGPQLTFRQISLDGEELDRFILTKRPA
ncbi:MAG: metallophosphoesterase [Planctomycetota bacterium]|nr:metallophosphoesterase [Planctomycetota bacterium]MDA1214735.1 metallophosphoesterase [Planctomycetota bacterium]